MLALFFEALGCTYKTEMKYRLRRFFIFDLWLYSFLIYGLMKWGFPV